jgi:hypothetical protein
MAAALREEYRTNDSLSHTGYDPYPRGNAFEPSLRAVFQRRLAKGAGAIITIDGPENHPPDAIRQNAFGRLREYVQTLRRGEIVHIDPLGWTIRSHPGQQAVITSEAEYNPPVIAHKHRLMPLWFASQFYCRFSIRPDNGPPLRVRWKSVRNQRI